MYAFGDDPNPSPESVAVLEDIVTEYINEMVIFQRSRNISFPFFAVLGGCGLTEVS